jgi:hypothetical protein
MVLGKQSACHSDDQRPRKRQASTHGDGGYGACELGILNFIGDEWGSNETESDASSSHTQSLDSLVRVGDVLDWQDIVGCRNSASTTGTGASAQPAKRRKLAATEPSGDDNDNASSVCVPGNARSKRGNLTYCPSYDDVCQAGMSTMDPTQALSGDKIESTNISSNDADSDTVQGTFTATIMVAEADFVPSVATDAVFSSSIALTSAQVC